MRIKIYSVFAVEPNKFRFNSARKFESPKVQSVSLARRSTIGEHLKSIVARAHSLTLVNIVGNKIAECKVQSEKERERERE